MSDPQKTRDYLKIFGPAVLITAIGFVIAYQFVDPAPPQRITLASGATDGAYYLFGQRYRDILAREGVELVVRDSAGSIENLQLLGLPEGGAEVGFVQGGTSAGEPVLGLTSLASLYFEPVWVFYRASDPVTELNQLAGKRVAVGAPGSGTRAVALQLLADNEAHAPNVEILPLGGTAAASALRTGGADVLFLVGSPNSPLVRDLLHDEGIDLMSFERSEAYTRIHRYLSSVTLPQGVIDLGRNRPAREITLLAPTANLVASPSLHPALVDLLLQAAEEVHAGGGLFEPPGQFPSRLHLEFPLNENARRYFKSGPSFLKRFLPFWAATLIDRLLVMLVPLLALAIPLVRVMPPVFRWRVRARIYRWYRSLLALDPALHEAATPAELERFLNELDRIELDVSRVNVPLSYADQLYHLRLHIELVRDKLRGAIAARTE